jgi:hypothetical protein
MIPGIQRYLRPICDGTGVAGKASQVKRISSVGFTLMSPVLLSSGAANSLGNTNSLAGMVQIAFDHDYFFAEQLAVTPNGRIEITFWGVKGKIYAAEHKQTIDDELWSNTPFAVTDTETILPGVNFKQEITKLLHSEDEVLARTSLVLTLP